MPKPARLSRYAAALCCVVASLLARADAPQPDAAAAELFEKKVRPLLVAECFKCHSTTSEKVKGGLILDSRDAMLRGGDSGAALVPGNPDESLIVKAVRATDKDLAMPPKKKLSSDAVAALAQWVKAGAPWPGSPAAPADLKPATGGGGGDGSAVAAHYNSLRQELWSWQPVKSSTVPPLKDAAAQSWAKTDIDRFVLAKLQEKDLAPSAPADKLTLLRRVTYDLTGLPPTPAEVEAFAKDASPAAFEAVVDRLLASPRFGERWGRHWLDVARYAESTGMTRNYVYHYAWRYRDYVIRAFNADKPYDRFVTEQLAGDLMPAASPGQRDEHLIATGFLTLGPRDYNEKNKAQFLMDTVDEQIDATSKALLATTVACARCHDHKFDPIPTAEYYSMAGIFKSTVELPGLDIRGPKQDKYSNAALVRLSGFAPGDDKDDDDEAPAAPRPAPLDKPRKGKGRVENGRGAASPARPLAMGVRDDTRPADTNVLVRGELDQKREVVRRGFLSIPCMADHAPAIGAKESGRRELAQWITDPANPLTARVYVNRVWAHLFGSGLVKSVDNFGTTGDRPSNPELLDYLATQFQSQGWSTKRLVRQVVLSAAYRQSSTFDKAKFAADPDNALLWRQNQRRLEAEAIRDAMLAAAGRLNVTPAGPSAALTLPDVQIGRRNGNLSDAIFNTTHRSVYLPLFRGDVPGVLDVFDMADPNVVDGRRDVTTVAPQALFMLNDAFVLAQSRAMVERLANSGVPGDAGRVEMAYRLALGRGATPAERDRALSYVAGATRDARAKEDYAKAQLTAWANLCQALFACAEFRYVN